MKLINEENIGFYSGVISSVFAIANLLGPILGGVITDNTTWRWIFFLKSDYNFTNYSPSRDINAHFI
jgi:predicted MFS family arabinose efflux permease